MNQFQYGYVKALRNSLGGNVYDDTDIHFTKDKLYRAIKRTTSVSMRDDAGKWRCFDISTPDMGFYSLFCWGDTLSELIEDPIFRIRRMNDEIRELREMMQQVQNILE